MGRFERPLLALALFIGLSAFASDMPIPTAIPGAPPERLAGPSLPFAVSLPDGFRITVVSGIDAATYVIKRGEEPYLFIINAQFPDFDFKTDSKGRVTPRVQQDVACYPIIGEGEEPPHRRILHLSDEWTPPGRRPGPGSYDFIIVWERVDLTEAKQAVADEIASTVYVPGVTQPIPKTDLLTCSLGKAAPVGGRARDSRDE